MSESYVNLCYGRDGHHVIESLTQDEVLLLADGLALLLQSDRDKRRDPQLEDLYGRLVNALD